MDEAGASPETAGGPRAAAVRRASDVWQRQLVDLSGRNRLLYYRDQQLGTIDLGAPAAPADPVAVDHLLAGSTVTLSQLFRPAEPPRRSAPRRPPSPRPPTASPDRRGAPAPIAGKADEMFEERGIRTLFLAVGMAHWTETTSAAQPAAPIVLFPLDITPRGAAAEDFDVKTVGDPQVSPTLIEKLATDFGLQLNAAELDDLLLGGVAPAGDAGWPIAEVLERLEKETAGKVPGFTVSERIVVANFSYHKLPMVKDLEACEPQLIAHDLVAAIAGDEAARAAVSQRDGAIDVDPALPDLQPPASEFLVVDADGTQSTAINAVLAGSNLVVKGPPGTGKSQTIANLIATLAAHRQRVLFVAEKRAAIDAVLKRLDAEDLGHLVMDLHHRAQSRRLIAQDLQAAFQASATTPAVDLATQQAGLVARRDRLNRYTEALHRPRDPWGESLFTILRALPETPPSARIAYRFPPAVLTQLDRDAAAEASAIPARPRRPRWSPRDRCAVGCEHHADARRRARRAGSGRHPRVRHPRVASGAAGAHRRGRSAPPGHDRRGARHHRARRRCAAAPRHHRPAAVPTRSRRARRRPRQGPVGPTLLGRLPRRAQGSHRILEAGRLVAVTEAAARNSHRGA